MLSRAKATRAGPPRQAKAPNGGTGPSRDIPSRSTFSASGPWSRAPSRATTRRHGHSPLRRGRLHRRAPSPAIPPPSASLREERGDDWLSGVAREMNLSETAFLRGADDSVGPALVHADRRGRPLRPRDARLGARALGAGAGRFGQGSPLPDEERRPDRRAARGGDRARFPGRAGRSGRGSAGPSPRSRRHVGPLHGPKPPGLPRRARLRSGPVGALARFREPCRRDPAGPRRHRHGRLGIARARLRLPLLRTRGRNRRGPRHRLRPLLPRPLLGAAPREVRADGLSGVGPRRHRRRAPLRRAAGSR